MDKIALVAALFLALLGVGNNAAASAKTFLDDAAGMSAYFSFTGPTNLSSNLLRNQFRVVELATVDYLLGSVPCAGFEADTMMDAKVLVHNAGWVVAYFPKDRPISQVVDQPMESSTRLDKVLAKIAYAVDVQSYVTSYTDFEHPLASGLARIGLKRNNLAGENSADVRLLVDQVIYEGGWHLRIQNSMVTSWLKLDGLERGRTSYEWGPSVVADGVLMAGELVTGARHVLTVGISTGQWGYSYGELDVLFSGPAGASLSGADWFYTIPLQAAPAEMQAAAADVPRFFSIYLPIGQN